jgi:uncharacterized protein (TIGR02001 family)
MWNRIAAIALAGVFAFSSAAMSEEKKEDAIDAFFGMIPGEFSADVTLTSDYVFRGSSQTGSNPALQGTFGYSLGLQKTFGAPVPINIYGSAWGSNVQFGNDQANAAEAGDSAYMEIDLTAGINTEIKGVSVDFFTIWYTYPDTSGAGLDYVEYGGGLGYDFGLFSVGASLYYSPDYTGNAGEFWYFSGDVSVPLPFKFTVDLHVGTQWFDRAANEDYTDWSVALSRDVLGFTLSVMYVDTDLEDNVDCGGAEICDARAVFSVSKSL